MAECPLIEKCIFFNDKMASMPVTSNMLKRQYCEGDNTQCARYMVFSSMGREHVPGDLFPNDTKRAKEIITGKKA